jgi:Phage tail protein
MPVTFEEPVLGFGGGDPDGPLPGSGLAVPAGVEAVFEYNGLYLNVLNNVDRYKIKSIDGLDDADMRDQREDNPGDDGETAYPSFYSGRPLQMQGTIQAYTLQKMRDMILALEQAFSNIREERPLIIHGLRVEQKVFINCRKNAKLTIQETQNDYRFFRDFLIPLRASNFRFLSLVRPSTTVSGLNAGAASVMSVTNLGSYPAQCAIRLTGGMTAPRVTNLTNNTMVKFEPTVVMTATSVRDISSFQSERWVKDENGNNKYNEITLDSTWVTLEPGVNNIEFSASAISGSAPQRTLTVFWRHCWK